MGGSRDEPPIIGIPTASKDDEGRVSVKAGYVEAIRRAGGLPWILPPDEPRLEAFLSLVDGLLLPGGGDVDPKRYGGAAHPTIYGVDAARDEADIRLSRHAARTGLPVLGVCRGAQVLNVALGGTLVEHLPDVVGEKVLHRARPSGHIVHPIELSAESRLADFLGHAPATPSSSHHQAIGRVAPGLAIAARAPDGTIEAVEMRSHPWLFAVQWHPEVNAARDPVEQRLFDRLVEAAREHKASR
jgi:putative glutamine amidotransferase